MKQYWDMIRINIDCDTPVMLTNCAAHYLTIDPSIDPSIDLTTDLTTDVLTHKIEVA